MVFTIQRDVVLLCAGEPPSSGPDDARFVVPGDKTFPPVKVWPGFKLLRSVLFGKNIKINVICAVRESENGPVYICSVDGLDDFSNEFLSVGGGSLRCVGSSMTGVVRELFSFLCQDEQKAPGQIKGPHLSGCALRAFQQCWMRPFVQGRKRLPAAASTKEKATTSSLTM